MRALSERPNLLLLLHLLQVDECRGKLRGLLSAFHQYAPVVGDGKLAVECGWKVAGLDVDGDIELAVRRSAKDAVGWRDIGIIPPDRSADVAVMGDQVVGRVESNPTQVRQEDVDPGMGRIGGRTVVVFTTAIKITGHVAGGNPDMPQQRNHGVSKVLANPFAAHDGIVDGRIDTCRPGNVFEVVEESLVDLVDEHKRVVAPGYAELRSQQGQRRSLDGKGAGKKHFPEVASFDQFVQSSPRVGSKKAWYIRQRLLLDDGFGDEDKLGMFARNVKVLDVVPLVVPIAEDAATDRKSVV